jgi:Holliday junction resolvase RusA-like endonuclease
MPELRIVTGTVVRSLVLDLVVPGNPVAWARAGINKKSGHVYPTRATEAAKQLLGLLALEQVKTPVEDDLEIEHVFYRETAHRVDGDNMQKLVWDAFNGVVWKDDSQVVDWSGGKRVDRAFPRTEIKVWKVSEAREAT